MPKGNNAIPHVHQRKHFNPCSSQKGNIKVFLNQPAQKIRRRRLRLLKAKRIFPRPLRSLRPQVNCPTIRHNMRRRMGRGFTLDELRAAGLNPHYASTIGIRVDSRRKNRSEEGLNINIERLKTYMNKLVVFPVSRKSKEIAEARKSHMKGFRHAQHRAGMAELSRMILPAPEGMRPVTQEEATTKVYNFLKKNHSAVRFMGARMARAKRRAEKAAEKK